MDNTKRASPVWTQDGHQPRIKVQGGYLGPTGQAPTPPKGGSSFNPTSASSRNTPPKKD